jgi:hypothetical protein
MKIRTLILATISIGLISMTTPVSAQNHITQICLGWTGGAAGTGYKWVSGDITWNGNNATIVYDWAGIGSMNGALADGILRGTWKQKNSDGGFYFSLPSGGQTTAAGKWWSTKTPDNKNAMTVTTDLSKCK